VDDARSFARANLLPERVGHGDVSRRFAVGEEKIFRDGGRFLSARIVERRSHGVFQRAEIAIPF
jgi:hypothetical protein